MRYDRALSSVLCLETFRSIFAVTLPLVRSNSWDAQLTVPNDPRYARLDKSGDQAGQGRVVTVRRKFCDTLAVGGRTLSC
ncbi:hypothetical protein TNCV_4786631 [Trichonephila clavipes]|nr:hypothetical protein TNCV_4786631 [Trichonephila clavipes]